ncbi:hypothetical protein Y981_10465 [Leptospirillum ferriphilum YSK]|uniref:Uncharacterized protein n=1 Tax=Leptospirillum ferriphilum YSK TaxID=1441628 RepID=A0A059XYE1_9BACT|nr:hypothetical protein Y981_10465 [Leptospirillum ferriphilum YSK]
MERSLSQVSGGSFNLHAAGFSPGIVFLFLSLSGPGGAGPEPVCLAFGKAWGRCLTEESGA